MGSDDTTVDDIGVGSSTGGGVVDVAGRARGLVRDGAKAPRSSSLRRQSTILDLLALLEPEVLDVIRFDRGNLKEVSGCVSSNCICARVGRGSISHLRATLDLFNSGFVELTSISVPLADFVRFLYASGVTLSKAARVDIGDPGQVSVGRNIILEGDDVLPRNDLRSTWGRSSQDGWEQSPKEDGNVAETGHFG